LQGLKKLAVIAAVSLCLLPATIQAGGTFLWQDSSREDFAKGTLDGLFFEGQRLRIVAKQEKLLRAPADLIWDIAASADGTIFAGSGHKGRIFRIGQGTAEIFYESGDTEVLSLAVSPEGVLFAGTGPGGRIIRLAGKDKAEVIFEKPGSYIWDIAFDRQGRLIAAAGGTEGEVLRFDENWQSKTLLSIPNSHILALAVSGSAIFAGTAPDGILYKITDGGAEVLYDAKERDIHAIAVDSKGNLYIGTADPGEPTEEHYQTKIISRLLSKVPGRKMESPPLIVPAKAKVKEKVENAVYRISPAGEVLEVFREKGILILSMAATAEGLYLGTSPGGVLHLVNENLESAKVVETGYAQILCIKSSGTGGLLLGTGGVGQVLRFGPEQAGEGKYISRVFDAGAPARWGRVVWEGVFPEGLVTLSTRSGNVAEPNETWSDWSEELTESRGSLIRSPAARFLQYRLRIKSSGKSSAENWLSSVRLYYLRSNRQPRIKVVRAGGKPAGKKEEPSQRKPATQSPKGKGSPSLNLSWEASDEDGDTLVYDIYFKGVEEENWKVIKKGTTETSYRWDTSSLPDGKYLVKVVASDRRDNPASRVLRHEKESAPFVIDNTPARIEEIRVDLAADGSLRIKAVARDNLSAISEAAYSIDGSEWKVLFPDDGIFDSPREEFSFTAPKLQRGEHIVTVRVRDARGNVSAGKERVRIP